MVKPVDSAFESVSGVVCGFSILLIFMTCRWFLYVCYTFKSSWCDLVLGYGFLVFPCIGGVTCGHGSIASDGLGLGLGQVEV